MIWSLIFTPDALPWSLLARAIHVPRGPDVYYSDGWCPMSPAVADGLSRALVFVTLGCVSHTACAICLTPFSSQFACCLGDTLASELGILSSSPPVLITTLKTVPAGTNGGISVGGTIASGIGGCIVGLVQFVSLVVENSVCRAEWTRLLPTLIGWGSAAGIFGSTVCDRLVSATATIVRSSDVV